MACYHPLNAYQSLTQKNENGKKIVTFSNIGMPKGSYEQIQLPCNQCIGCRIDRSRDWALRCVHEASMWTDNCFITLTFDDENINKLGTLVKSDFQKFIKRLRKKFRGNESTYNEKGKLHYPIRYFHCGEYGTDYQRPHHHACIFNFDFLDKELWTLRSGTKLFRSKQLEKLWPYGFCTVGEVTFESAAYCARYITKKITGEKAEENYSYNGYVDKETGECYKNYPLSHGELVEERIPFQPEYITMSRRPGIGKGWYEKYGETDIRSKDFCTLNGKKFKTPRFYDKIYDEIDRKKMEVIREQRKENAKKYQENNTLDRLHVREEIQKVKAKKLIRGYENEAASI